MFEIHDGPQFSSIVSDQGSKTLKFQSTDLSREPNEADYNAADAAPTTWELFKRIANAIILENDTPTSMTQWRMIMMMMMPSSDRMYSGRSFKI